MGFIDQYLQSKGHVSSGVDALKEIDTRAESKGVGFDNKNRGYWEINHLMDSARTIYQLSHSAGPTSQDTYILWRLDFGVGVFHEFFAYINFGGNELTNYPYSTAGTNFYPQKQSDYYY